MSIFTESEVNFLNLLTEDIFTESSEKDRSGVLDKTLEVLENLGYNPKISKSSKDKWIKTNNSGDFGESLCILIGQVNNLSKVCTDVNKVIKPMNAKVSPDNYGTIFLAMKESVVTESYIGNYFRNKILLHRLGKNPELNRKSLIKFMKNLATNYESSLLDDEVKEIMKKKDVADYFLPKGSLKFPDGMEIEFAFCYDKKSFTPGAAFKNDDGRYIVLLYPMLFEYDDIEEQLYILMHEIGHIRLGHCERQHQTLFDHENRRGKVMVRGGVVYPELNADLYAVLNGSKMYTILQDTINNDHDKKYDYRYTNNELAKRYGFVFKKYPKYKGSMESVDYIAESEDTGSNDKILADLNYYIKSSRTDDSLLNNIDPLEKPIIHESKKNGKWLLLATLNSMDKKSTDKLLALLHDNVMYSGEAVEFHTCYLPGDVFVYIELPESVKESENIRTTKTGKFEIEKEYFKVYNGKDYAYVTIKGSNKPLRGRSEVLIMKDDEVFLCFEGDKCRVPGGGWDKGESYEHAAIREAKEESRLVCHNVEYATTRVDMTDSVAQKCIDENIPEEGYWYGYFTKVFIGEYDKNFSGHIDKDDTDPNMIKRGKFYKFDEVKDKMHSEHKEAIEKYLEEHKELIKESQIYEIDAEDDDVLEAMEFVLEAATDSHIIVTEIYPRIEEVLSTPAGDKLFKRYVEDFVDRNTERLHEPCPISMIAFTDHDKAKFYDLFNFTEKELVKIVSRAVNAVSDTAQFKLVKQNPIFSVFYLVLRYYILKNDEAGINSTLVIHALASYPSVFSKYFKYGANAGIMQYTADHLTEKFIFKQEKHVFGALRKSIYSAYAFLKPYFKEAADKEIVRYIQRIRNDQNSMIKKIASEYNKNKNAGKTVSTQTEAYDTGALIDDYSNDTSKVETITQKIIINLLTNGIDLRILETAGAMAQLSITELRLYLTKILVDARSEELDEFISAVLFIYLFDNKHEISEIRSRVFLSYGIELFRKTNSNNKNIVTIKSLLDKWAEETGIHSRYKREPTRISYKKGIYWYILLTIQTNV